VKKIIFYTLFSVLVTVFFLFFLFPKEKIEKYIDYQVFRVNPDLRLTIGDLGLYYPPYVKIKNTTLYYQQQSLFNVSSARIRPGLAVVKGRGTMAVFNGRAHHGRFSGKILSGGASAKSPTIIRIDLAGIELDGINGLKSVSGVSIAGKAEGSLRFASRPSQPGQGMLDLVFSECTIQLANALFDVKTVRFTKIELKADILGNTAGIRLLKLTGPQVNATFEGEVALRSPMKESRLNITGKIRLQAEFMARLKKKIPAPLWPGKQLLNTGIPVSVSGTVGNPLVGLK